MPAKRKFYIPPNDLQSVRDGTLTVQDIAIQYGCAWATALYWVRNFDKPDAVSAIEPGKGGDVAFDAQMGERRFEDHPRVRPTLGMPRLWPHGSSDASLTGSSAAWAAN